MNTVPKSRIPVKPLPEKTTDEAKVEKWRQLGAEHGLSGEWAVPPDWAKTVLPKNRWKISPTCSADKGKIDGNAV